MFQLHIVTCRVNKYEYFEWSLVVISCTVQKLSAVKFPLPLTFGHTLAAKGQYCDVIFSKPDRLPDVHPRFFGVPDGLV